MTYGRLISIGLPMSLILCACSDGHDHGMMTTSSGPNGGTDPQSVMSYAIDTDMMMEDITPGQEVGAFIDYEAGGLWHVNVTCDSSATGGAACQWEVLTNPLDGYWSEPTPEGLEPNDQSTYDEYGPRMLALTTNDFDGISFSTDPGTTVRFELWLYSETANRYEPANRYLYWVSGGAVNMGAATNPVDLKPSTP